MAHWLDDVIALVARRAHELAGGNPDKAAEHDTAAKLLASVRDAGSSHDDAQAAIAGIASARPESGAGRAASSGPPPFAG